MCDKKSIEESYFRLLCDAGTTHSVTMLVWAKPELIHAKHESEEGSERSERPSEGPSDFEKSCFEISKQV